VSLKYFAASTLTPGYVTMLRGACREVFPEGMKLLPIANALRAQLILDPALDTYDDLKAIFQHYADLVPWPGFDAETLYFDIETDSVDARWAMTPEKFFRLGQYAWGVGGEVHLTTSLEEMRYLIRKAHGVVGHNIHSFDLSLLLGDEALLLPRVFDTFVHANMVNPAPYSFTVRSGHTYFDGAKPEKAMIWLSLDNQCFVLTSSPRAQESIEF